ncbi:unnamed protein product [Diamesa serratosioi]
MPLALENCSPDCDEETGLILKFNITSLVLSDIDKNLGFENILINLTFDGNVIKIEKNTEDDEFREEKILLIRSTTRNLCTKLKTCPILLNLSRGCEELGIIKLAISDCFAEAITCNDFNSQKVTSELEFQQEEKKNGLITICVSVEKAPNDELNALYKQYGATTQETAKKRKVAAKQNKKMTGGAGEDEEIVEEEEEDGECEDIKDICDEFECPDQISDACKVNMVLKEKIYKIFNGNLINIRDKVGPCGVVKCPTASKMATDLCKLKMKTPTITPQNLYDMEPKCGQMMDPFPCGCHVENKIICTACGGISQMCSKASQLAQDPVVEESTLKMLCKEYGINLDEIQGPNTSVQSKCKKMKRRKKCSKAFTSGDVDRKPMAVTRTKYIKAMKRKSRGKYCYDFGDNHPRPHTCCPQIGGGDSCAVPKYMGWKWDIPIVGTRNKVWYPGQINKNVREIMKCKLNPYPYDTIPLTRRDEKGNIVKTCTDYTKLPEFNPECMAKPTLHIQKKDGEYKIIMNPLKSCAKLATDCNPYINCSPIAFHIKRNPEQNKIHKAKKLLKSKGFTKKCDCSDFAKCRCMSSTAKRLLLIEMKRVSVCMKLKKNLEACDLYDSSDSEMNLEFTTPSAVIKDTRCKPDVVHVEVQYDRKDFLPPPKIKPRAIRSALIKKKDEKSKAVKCEKPKLKKQVETVVITQPCRPQPVCRTNRCLPPRLNKFCDPGPACGNITSFDCQRL